MSTTRDDIIRWIRLAPHTTRWMLVICDTFEHCDFPAYFDDADKCMARVAAAQRGDNMERLMECYDLAGDVEAQISERRAMHLPDAARIA